MLKLEELLQVSDCYNVEVISSPHLVIFIGERRAPGPIRQNPRRITIHPIPQTRN